MNYTSQIANDIILLIIEYLVSLFLSTSKIAEPAIQAIPV